MLKHALETAGHYSQFVRQNSDRYPDLLSEMDLLPLASGALFEQAKQQLGTCADEDSMKRALRNYRRFQMQRIAVRDLAQIGSLDETLRDASDLADALIALSYRWAFDFLAVKWGQPVGGDSGTVQELIILGMGKLGGYELNYSSDIDLIFVFPEKGMTQGGERSISNDEFFTKVGQLLNNLLNTITSDGMVFRVDMRLRPFGTAGQLVHSFDGFEQYYQVHGRPWERYAMVKARAITGKEADIHELESLLRPFIYRRYVDFTMLESLRELKGMIAREVLKKGADRDVKLGAGGIREVEFIAQAFQLVHGGQDALLRGRELMPMLSLLAERNYLDSQVAQSLLLAYRFLRDVENRLQMWADQQTHLLPTEPERMTLLAQSMGFDSSDAFMVILNGHRTEVKRHFDAVLGVNHDAQPSEWLSLWQQPETALLTSAIETEQDWREQLAQLQQSRQVALLSNEAKGRLDAVMPLLLAEVAQQQGAVETLKRVLSVVQAVLKRSAYLVLLRESQQARVLLVRLCAASPWLTDYLVKMPALLDQLLDERILFTPLSRDALSEELAQQLVSANDDEQMMEVLRHFKHAQVFRVAASDITGALSLMTVSDYLTWIAEAIVDTALKKAWQLVVTKHGKPADVVGDDLPFVVIAFGKLGGLELSYGSDLDMVYLSDDRLNAVALTDGERPIENTVFFTRLGQKLSSLLATQTMSGMAYEVDMQLRPHGASGSLVSTLAAFFRYEQEQAWTWEHQALIRTRAIAGCPELMARFETQRRDFLCQPRDNAELKAAVVSMRDKMRAHLDKSTAEQLDLKQGAGGIIDIEFLVQYWVLSTAHQYPEVVQYSDNIRQLSALAKYDVISESVAQGLSEAYRAYRTLAHRMAMSKQEMRLIPRDSVAEFIGFVGDVWQQTLVEWS
jgi:glutamate-ammonia-ligase adenylyltransferase